MHRRNVKICFATTLLAIGAALFVAGAPTTACTPLFQWRFLRRLQRLKVAGP